MCDWYDLDPIPIWECCCCGGLNAYDRTGCSLCKRTRHVLRAPHPQVGAGADHQQPEEQQAGEPNRAFAANL